MHQPMDLGCEACTVSPFMVCVQCEAQNLQARSIPMSKVSDFWALAWEIMFPKP